MSEDMAAMLVIWADGGTYHKQVVLQGGADLVVDWSRDTLDTTTAGEASRGLAWAPTIQLLQRRSSG